MIKINMFQAGYGDSILVQIRTTESDQSNILIDCGFNYKQHILPRLKELLKHQTINKFIITHYDSDHIRSASTFLEDNGQHENPKIAKIEDIWLNTYKHLQFSKRNTEEFKKEEKTKIEHYVSELLSIPNSESIEGDIGAKQASTLGKTILRNRYPWNTNTNGEAICIENLREINITKDVKLHLLSPNKERLQNLESEFIDILSEMGLYPNSGEIFDDAFELFLLDDKENISYGNEGNINSSEKIINSNTIKIFAKGENYLKDDAIGNGSSISFILEAEGKKILFLADAFAEDIIKELKRIYHQKTEYPIFFDAIKTSHHGSFRNNSPDLFELIDSDHFLFSTNGLHQSHQHPDIETISCIITRVLPNKVLKRNLIFNYELDHLKGFNNEELKTEFNYDIKIQVETKI